jgi:mannose PTS system EIIA component
MGGEVSNMVGLVVAAHGRLAQELVATAEQIMGKLPEVTAVSIEPGAPAEAIRQQMRAAVKEMDHGNGVLVLADLFGGTPCKESLLLCGKENVEVLAGVNLPMLMKAASLRKEPIPLHDLAEALLTYAQRNIRFASELLRDAAARHATTS